MISQSSNQAPSQSDQMIKRLEPWFHNIHLPDGAQTAPHHFLGDFPTYLWEKAAGHLPADLTGWRVLDIGCNAGFYSVKLAHRGARVTGIDLDPHYLTQARWVVDRFGLADRINLEQRQIYELAQMDKMFDLVVFMGVFYHLRYPLLGLDIAAQRTRRLLLFQTMLMPGEAVVENTFDRNINDRLALREPGWPKMAFLEHHFAGDPTNWWVCNRAGVEALLRSSGLRIIHRPDSEIYLCEPDPERPASVAAWNRAEFLAATGQPWHRLTNLSPQEET